MILNKAQIEQMKADEARRAEVLRRAGERTEWQILQEKRDRENIAAMRAMCGHAPPVEPEPVDLDSL